MSYQEKSILRDKDGNVIPQIWNEDVGDFVPYEAILRARAPDGQLIDIQADAEGKLKLDANVEVDASGIVIDLGSLVIKAKDPSGNQTDLRADDDGNLKVSSGGIVTIAGMSLADRPPYTEITVPTAFVLLNETLDTWVTDGSADWVEV